MGRRALVVASATVVVLVAGACQNWSQYMGHPNLDGNNAAETTINRNNVDTLRESYRVDLGSPERASLTPVVSGGVI